MKKHIPNFITCLNLLSGASSVLFLAYGFVDSALLCIFTAMIFDFSDGLAAKLLNARSDMGKELDSLADVISFGMAPGALAHILIKNMLFGENEIRLELLTTTETVLMFLPLLIPVSSALRLAKFNVDTGQSLSFTGMPTPANALFWTGLAYSRFHSPDLYTYLFGSVWIVAVSVIITSFLLISELPMFSFKIRSLSWKENKERYTFLLIILCGILLFRGDAFVFIVPTYILFSIISVIRKSVIDKQG